jgi:hypothetical protein
MRVGDLVKFTTTRGFGVVVGIRTNRVTPMVCEVFTRGKVFAFLPSQMEIISEAG